MNITKSAPLPERLCEQLTCCEKNGSVQGNYINRVTKRHNCRITGKTKATCYGGHSTQATRYPQRMSIANNATFAAGGQRVNSLNFAQLRCTGLSFSYTKSGISFSALPHALSLPTGSLLMQYFMRNANTNREPSQYGICCISYSVSAPLDFLRWRSFSSCSTFSGKNPADLFSGSDGLLSVCFLVIHQPFCSLRCHTCNGRVFLYSFRNFSRANAHGANLSDSDSCAIFLRRFFLIGDDVFINSLSFMVLSCKAMCRSSSHHGAGCFYSDSLALRRWRRLISPCIDAMMNCDVLSPDSFTDSMAFTISCGTRAFRACDFAFVVPVAISIPLVDWWGTVYTEKTQIKLLTWTTPKTYSGPHLKIIKAHKCKAPQVSLPLAGLLTTNDRKSIEVAMRNHTTHPQGRDLHNLNKPDVKNLLLATASQGYDLYAPAKSGAGIGVLVFNEAHNTRPACFFVPDSHTLSMVGCMGAEQSAPGSSLTGYANPVQSTASEIGVSCGGFINPNEEAANMATVPTLVHSQTAFIWRFIIFGASESQIIHVTAWTEREARNHCPSGCVAVFAARIRQEVRHD